MNGDTAGMWIIAGLAAFTADLYNHASTDRVVVA